jgi:hypothetical protein
VTTLQPIFALNGTIEKDQKFVVAILNLGNFSDTDMDPSISDSGSLSPFPLDTNSSSPSDSLFTIATTGTSDALFPTNSFNNDDPSPTGSFAPGDFGSDSNSSSTTTGFNSSLSSTNQTQVLHFLGANFTANFTLETISILMNNSKALVEYLPPTTPNGTLPDR